MASLQHSWLYAKNPTLYSYPSKQNLSPASKQLKVCVSQNESPILPNSPEPSGSISQNSSEASTELNRGTTDPVKRALERAKAYKKTKAEQEREKTLLNENNTDDGVQFSLKIAMQEAIELNKISVESVKSGREGQSDSGTVKKQNSNKSPSGFAEQNNSKRKELIISSIDFVGLNFSDKKKSRGLPPGLVPVSDSFPQGEVPEIEIIVGDTTKFGDAMTTSEDAYKVSEDTSKVYKPKVSSWGVFPRPCNISKTFGGGKNIQPGDALETAEERAVKDARTRQLLAAYKEKVGLEIDPKLKSECEKVLEDGNSLMDVGRLRAALPYYEEVMDKMAFKSELHGLAALQWSICQDSLRRPNEARIMYEKLQSHPKANVSKKAKQFMFSFQAMEMMQVTSASIPATNTAYRNYFEAFVEDKTNYTSEDNMLRDGVLNQTLPYVIFLVSPIILVLAVAVQKGNVH